MDDAGLKVIAAIMAVAIVRAWNDGERRHPPTRPITRVLPTTEDRTSRAWRAGIAWARWRHERRARNRA